MLQNDFTTELLDLKDCIITSIKANEQTVHISFEMRRRTQQCPHCHAYTDKIHDYRIQQIKDLPIQGKNTILHYRKRRYHCSLCSKNFYEKFYLLPKYHRITNRLALYSLIRLENKQSIKDIAREMNVSSSSILRWMNYRAFPKAQNLPQVISIDEFRGNASGEKFQFIINDPKNKRVIDILPTRKQDYLMAYFSHFDKMARNNVKIVCMDMYRSYLEVVKVCLPNAKIVIDKFHVSRHNVWCFERVRKKIQSKLMPYERRYFKRSRTLLLKHYKDLTESETDALSNMLKYSTQLAHAYVMLQKIYEFMDSKDIDTARENLSEIRRLNSIAQIEEYQQFFLMLKTWETYILNAFIYKYSNGFTEGLNNSIKVIKRVSYGIRNFENMRRRIMIIYGQPKTSTA